MSKVNVGLIFGGYSAEHDVSIMSATSIAEAIDKEKFSLHFIGFDKNNTPHLINCMNTFNSSELFEVAQSLKHGELVDYLKRNVDVVLPIIHGPGGEDGKLQGLLEFIDIPYVGAGVAASSLCMDKRLTKAILKANGFLQPKYMSLSYAEYCCTNNLKSDIAVKLGYPVFVKPSNLGSSIGITKVKSASQLDTALQLAFKYDNWVLIEKGIVARELECAVYGNQNPTVMAVGEIIPSNEMYDYEAKYSELCLSELIVPAQASKKVIDKIKQDALFAYKILGVEGMARVDFLVDKINESVYINELNTLPGFTKYSMFPLLCQAEGLDYTTLITTLIRLAFERKKR